MFEACTLPDSLACASVSGVCSSAAHCVRKSVYCESLFCETDFLLGGQVCTVRELSGLLSKLPWAVKHIFDEDDCKRNEARDIVDTLKLREVHDAYSVSNDERIYVVLHILYTALNNYECNVYKDVDQEIIWAIQDTYCDAKDYRNHLYAKSPDAWRDHYNAWRFKHPTFEELWIACDDAYDVYGHDDDAHNKARETLVRFGLIDNVSDLPDEETLLRRARVYFDECHTASGGGRCLASRDSRDCRSTLNECVSVYSVCQTAAYRAARKALYRRANTQGIGGWCGSYRMIYTYDETRVLGVPFKQTWCGCSLMLRKPRAVVELRPEERKHLYTWSKHLECLRNACRYIEEGTCRTPAESRREAMRERRNARRREARYMRKQVASVRNGEQDYSKMIEVYENRVDYLQKRYRATEWLRRISTSDSLRTKADRAFAEFVAARMALHIMHLSVMELECNSLK